MIMADRFGRNVTQGQFKLAKRFEEAGLCTIQQAVEAFEKHQENQIEEWRNKLPASTWPAAARTDVVPTKGGGEDKRGA